MKLRTKLLLPTVSISVMMIIFIVFVVSLGIRNFSLKDKAQAQIIRASASREIEGSVNALKEMASIIQSNRDLVNSLELENQFETLDLITPFSDQSKVDFVVVYDKDLNVFGRSDRPGEFGSADDLYQDMVQLKEAGGSRYVVKSLNEELTVVYLEALDSINGFSGVLAVGRNIDDDFLKPAHQDQILNIFCCINGESVLDTDLNLVGLAEIPVLAENDVSFLVEIPESSLNGNLLVLLGLGLSLVIIICGFFVWKSFQTLNRISKRILWVSNSASQLVSGHFPKANREIRSDDEIGYMVDSIEKANKAIVVYNKQLEKARDAALEMAIAKSQFLSNMSHEIRTPMNGVLGLLESLDFNQLSPENRNLISIAQKSGEDLIRIINDILTFSKLDVGKEELEISPFSLPETLQRDVLLLTPAFEENQITLSLSIVNENDHTWLMGDSTRLGQVIKNLLGNARKFSPENSTVQLNAHCKDLDNGTVELAVEVIDEGIGIAPENLKTVFESFSQADGSITRRFGGTGLGLTICQELIHLMGGEIGVESKVGHGSRFYFTVRLAIASKPEPTLKQVTAASGQIELGYAADIRILLVEDNKVNVIVARSLLNKMGFDPDVAHNGQEALDMVGQHDYDLILMDCQMPVLNGYDATRELRARGYEMPVIALTANALSGDREKCFEAGMNEYVTKPIKRNVLEAALESLLSLPVTS